MTSRFTETNRKWWILGVMGAIPSSKSGQAGGINLTAQFIGSTVDVTIGSALFAMTGNYQVIFLVAGFIGFSSFSTTWFTIPNRGRRVKSA